MISVIGIQAETLQGNGRGQHPTGGLTFRQLLRPAEHGPDLVKIVRRN
jgi:hypothetical protein